MNSLYKIFKYIDYSQSEYSMLADDDITYTDYYYSWLR